MNTYLGDPNNEKVVGFYRNKLREGRQGYVIASTVDVGRERVASGEDLPRWRSDSFRLPHWNGPWKMSRR